LDSALSLSLVWFYFYQQIGMGSASCTRGFSCGCTALAKIRFPPAGLGLDLVLSNSIL